MTPRGARTAFRALGLDVKKAMKVFDRSERAVFYWLDPEGKGPPDHIALAIYEMLHGRLAREDVAKFIKACRSRRDGDRYDRSR